MRHVTALILIACFAVSSAHAQNIDGQAGGASITVKENDNTPTVSNVSSISFSNGTVTDDGGGNVSVTISGTGAPTDATYTMQYAVSASTTANQRIQVDNSDQPAGQTTAAYDFRRGTDGTDEDPMVISTSVTNMTAAAHTVDLDGSVDATTSTPQAETATLWAVTMELPAAGSDSSGVLRRRFSGQ